MVTCMVLQFFGSADVGMHAHNTMTTYYVYLLFGKEVADLQSEFCCILKVVVFSSLMFSDKKIVFWVGSSLT